MDASKIHDAAPHLITIGKVLRAMANMIVKLKGNELSRKKIDKSPFWFGSDPLSDFLLDNPAVSAQHFRIEFGNFQYRLIDDSSTNGTFLNEQKVTEKVLEPGMIFVVGKFTIEIQDLHEPPDVVRDPSEAGADRRSGAYRSTVQLDDGSLKHALSAALEQRSKQEIQSSAENVTHAPRNNPPPSSGTTGGGNAIWLVVVFVIILIAGILIGRML